MKWRIGKKVEILARAEPDLSGNHRPDRNSRTKNTVLVSGPAACWLGLNVLIAIPSAAKLSPPSTSTITRAPIPDAPDGRWTPNAQRPTASISTTWANAIRSVLTRIEVNSVHVGSGLSRRRLSSPVSRRMTRLIARLLNDADITP